jgi:hypothetical protein
MNTEVPVRIASGSMAWPRFSPSLGGYPRILKMTIATRYVRPPIAPSHP